MPSTGETCTETGDYTGRCNNGHTETAHFTKGDTFTPCAKCGGSNTPGGAVMNWTKK
jgi:hypothetical protein